MKGENEAGANSGLNSGMNRLQSPILFTTAGLMSTETPTPKKNHYTELNKK